MSRESRHGGSINNCLQKGVHGTGDVLAFLIQCCCIHMAFQNSGDAAKCLLGILRLRRHVCYLVARYVMAVSRVCTA